MWWAYHLHLTLITSIKQHYNHDVLNIHEEVLHPTHPKVRRPAYFNINLLLEQELGVGIQCLLPSLKPFEWVVYVTSHLFLACLPWIVNPWNPPSVHHTPLHLAWQKCHNSSSKQRNTLHMEQKKLSHAWSYTQKAKQVHPNYHYKKTTSMMICVCHSRSRFLSCMYIHEDFMTESR